MANHPVFAWSALAMRRARMLLLSLAANDLSKQVRGIGKMSSVFSLCICRL